MIFADTQYFMAFHGKKRSRRHLISSFAFIVDAQVAFNYTRPPGKLRIRCNK